jgi:DNA-binding beta-propeller fold protein YncE
MLASRPGQGIRATSALACGKAAALAYANHLPSAAARAVGKAKLRLKGLVMRKIAFLAGLALAVGVLLTGGALTAASGLTAASVTAAQPGQVVQLTGPGACVSQLETEEFCSDGRALNSPDEVVVSPDGRSVYVAAFGGVSNDAGGVAVFERSSPGGRIAQRADAAGCVSNTTAGCGTARGLSSASGLAVSPDGRSVYATGFFPGSVVAFSRSARGDLAQLPGLSGCTAVDGASGCRRGRALSGADDVEVSPDGRSVYVTSFYSDSVGVFARDRGTGQIEQLAGSSGCNRQPDEDGRLAEGCSAAIGLSGPIDLAISPDGRNVYVVSALNRLAAFRREASGALVQLPGPAGCFSDNSDEDGCTAAAFLKLPLGIAISADGRHLYVASYYEESGATITALRRDPVTGRLTPLAGGVRADDLEFVSDLAVAPDGANVYAVSPARGALLAFARTANGALAQLPGEAACVTDAETADSCPHAEVLARASALAVSPDGRSVYVAAVQPGGGSELKGPQYGSLSVFSRQVSLILSLSKPRASPTGIRAGASFSISTRVTTDAPSIKLACSGRVAARGIGTRIRRDGGDAVCSGVVPAGAAGKRLTGRIEATAGDTIRVTTFSFPIRGAGLHSAVR